MNRTKDYITMVRAMAILSNGMMLLVLGLLYRNNRGPLLVAFGLFGFTTLPLLPLVIENCAEISYPVPEFISYGLVAMLLNIFSLIFTFVFQVLIQVDRFAPRPLTAVNIGMYLIYLVLTIIIVVSYRGKQLRVDMDSSAAGTTAASTAEDRSPVVDVPSSEIEFTAVATVEP
jgi:hypothetical protein